MHVLARLTVSFAVLGLTSVSIPARNDSWGGRVGARVQPPADTTSLPRFDRVLLLESASDTSANVSIGDLNADGRLDILLVKGRHWPSRSRVLLGDGRGHFSNSHNLAETAYRSYSGHLIDIDGDGDLDVVLSNDSPDAKVVYLNDGTGHFQLGTTYGRAEWNTRNASVTDVDGDGQPDIVVANRGEKEANYICLNRGKGRFDADCAAFSKESATTITPADFNHDGLVDYAVPHRDGGQSYVYFGTRKATYSNLKRIAFGPPDATIRMTEQADLDGDGMLDIVAIDGRRGCTIYFGKKNGSFASGVPLRDGDAMPYALAVSDVNHDGKMDIIVGNVEAPSTIHVNGGTGHRYTPIHFGDDKGTVYGFAIADLDGDGLLDIAAARSEAPSAIYFAKR